MILTTPYGEEYGMRNLSVYIEIRGNSIYVGDIIGNDSNDACFSYADTYRVNLENPAISISLPLNKPIRHRK